MDQIALQYIQVGIMIALGLVGVFLPLKYNPFQFKKYGIGGVLGDYVPEKVQQKLPKIIGAMLIFAGVVVGVLTPFLGPLPW